MNPTGHNILSLQEPETQNLGITEQPSTPHWQWHWKQLPIGTETYFANANSFGQSQRLALLIVLTIPCKCQYTVETIANWYGDLYFSKVSSIGEGAKDLHYDRGKKWMISHVCASIVLF
jgi:hypothetical protein